MRRAAALVTGWLLVVAPSALHAQTTPPQSPRPPARTPARPPRTDVLPKFSIGVGGGMQVSSGDFTQQIAFPLFGESARVTGDVKVGHVPHASLGVGVRLRNRLGVGLAVTSARHAGRQAAQFSLPDPFLFGQPHTATTETGSKRSILEVQLRAMLLLSHRPPWQITVFGGPTFTQLRQELATDRVRYDFQYPFTTLTLSPVSSGTSKGDRLGGHAGVSIARRWTRRVWLEGDVVGSVSTVELDAGDQPVRVQAGGVRAGGGLRFVF
jgi:hypothetical protein